MLPMLEIRLIMNSAVEDILSFKTCCGLKMFDQNLEIHLINRGPSPVVVPSCFDLETPEGVRRIDTPHAAGGPAYRTGGDQGLLLLYG